MKVQLLNGRISLLVLALLVYGAFRVKSAV